jgi:hypothetical protein
MLDVLVDVAAAVICFAGACHPVLVGNETPRGEFQLEQFTVQDPRYGGDLLAFKFQAGEVFAIHRVFDVPGQQRLARLNSPYAKHRIQVTNGCVNVAPEVYQQLIDCCSDSKVTIK